MSQPEHYHDGHCNAGRNKPMGCRGCSCYMYQRARHVEAQVEALQRENEQLVQKAKDSEKYGNDMERRWDAAEKEHAPLEEAIKNMLTTIERLKAPVSDEELSEFECNYGATLGRWSTKLALGQFITSRATQPSTREGK